MKKALLICAMFLVLQLFTGIVGSAVAGLLGYQGGAAFTYIIIVATLVSDLLMIGFVYFLMERGSRTAFRGYLGRPTAFQVVLSVLALLMLMVVINALLEVLGVPDLIKEDMASLMRNPLGILTVSLLGPIAEEVCFRRGVMGSLMESGRSSRKAILISAALFGIIPLKPGQVLGAFALGLFFGWLYWRTHSLVLPIVCHVLNNSISTLLFFLDGQDSTLQEHFPSAWLFGVTIAAAAAVGYLLVHELNKKLPQGISELSEPEIL